MLVGAALIVPRWSAVPEKVSATTLRGGPGRDGTTSDRAVPDVSSLLWHHSGPRVSWRPREPRPAVAVGDVVLASAGQHVVALDANSGAQRWQAAIDPVDLHPGMVERTAATLPVMTTTEVLSIDVASGAIVRRVRLTDEASARAWPWAQVAVPLAGGYVARSVGGVVAVRPDGSERWRFTPESETWVRQLLPAGDGVLIVGDDELRVLAADGRTLWRARVGVLDRPRLSVVVAGGIVAVTTPMFELLGFDVRTGDRVLEVMLDRREVIADVRDDVVTLVPAAPPSRAFFPERLSRYRLTDGERLANRRINKDVPPGSVIAPHAAGAVVRTPTHVFRVGEDGAAIWVRELDGAGHVDVAAAGGLVLASSADGTAVLDDATGDVLGTCVTTPRWTPLAAGMALAGPTVIARDGPWIDIRSGQRVTKPSRSSWRPTGGLLVGDDAVVLETPQGLRSVGPRGREQWRHRGRGNGWPAGLLHADGRVVATDGKDSSSGLVVLDADDGVVLGRHEAMVWPWGGSVAKATSIVVWAQSHPDTWPADQLQRWNLDPDGSRLTRVWSRPAVWTGGLMLVGDSVLQIEGALVTVRDLATGKRTATVRLPFLANDHAAVTDGLVVATDGRRVAAVDLRAGTLRWQQRLHSPAVSDPVAAGELVYLAHADGTLTVRRVADGTHVTRREVTTDPAGAAAVLVADGTVVVRYGNDLWAFGPPDARRGGTPPGGEIELPGL